MLTIIFLLALFSNIYFSIQLRKKYPYPAQIEFSTVPELFKKDVKRSMDDGYKLSSVSDDIVIMVKRRHLFSPWFLSLITMLPLNTAFNSWYLCGLYCLRFRLVEGEIEVDTI